MLNNDFTFPQHLIIYDGVCNFCSAGITFMLKWDRHRKFTCIPAQSHAAEKLFKQHPPGRVASIVLIYKGNCLIKSTAILRILYELGYPWRIFYIFKFVPLKWRDRLYDFIAANRYRWWGRKKYCQVPSQINTSGF